LISAGIVLAGGRSSRMGADKASLAWHGSTLLGRVVSIVARAVDGPVIVVGAPSQLLPRLHVGVEVVNDAVPGRGPLGGIASGLAAAHGRCAGAFVCCTDAPFLHPAFVRRVLSGCSEGFEACVPVVGGHHQPLAAAYRPSVLAEVETLLAGGRGRVSALLERCPARLVDEAWLLGDPQVAALDPELDSIRNLNRPGEYAAALARPQPEVAVERGGRRVLVRASTLGGAADQAGAGLVGEVIVNGERVGAEPELALVAGDTVVFA
jgi:molybdopterin-guanine dinucleotide biosynthesis protein A